MACSELHLPSPLSLPQNARQGTAQLGETQCPCLPLPAPTGTSVSQQKPPLLLCQHQKGQEDAALVVKITLFISHTSPSLLQITALWGEAAARALPAQEPLSAEDVPKVTSSCSSPCHRLPEPLEASQGPGSATSRLGALTPCAEPVAAPGSSAVSSAALLREAEGDAT